MSAGGSAWIADTRIVGFGFHETTSRSISKIATGNPTDEIGSLSEITSSKEWAGRRTIPLRSSSPLSFVRLTGRQRRSRNATSARILRGRYHIPEERNSQFDLAQLFLGPTHIRWPAIHWVRQSGEAKLRLRIE